MKQTIFPKYLMPSKFLAPRMALFALLLASFSSTACSTANARREVLSHVFDAQNDVLTNLRLERKSSHIATKVQAEPALSEAESHLDQAIQSLMDSNNAVKAAL